ncbi:alpha/beta hydrolase [Clostridium perfringens]|uniref:alpha/beta hydrolase n=1 Tax=Clostridium perfringens TaxID=1502 RepID=UPI0024BC5F01|nr:alpha/beta hydrolase [Clostridium perfringens]
MYPLAKIESESYAALANKITQAGYEAIIIPVPLKFATFNYNASDEELYQNSICGHSLGGVMTTKYAGENSNLTKLQDD